MGDFTWLAQEAKNIHGIFYGLFYSFLVLLLVLGVIIEYFKLPIGGLPAFPQLVGRCLIASFLLSAYPEITNHLAEFTDAMAQRLGDLNSIKLVLSRMGDKLGDLTWSWLSVKDTLVMALSFMSFFLLYFSVFVCEAFMIYTWTLLYVFSPVLIALFVLPQTASATTALFRSLIEVSCWKIVWSVLATLLWSSALNSMNGPEGDFNFITVVCFNIILAGSVLLTPIVVRGLASSGLSGTMGSVGGMAIGATVIGPHKVLKASSMASKRTYNAGVSGLKSFSEKRAPKINSFVKKAPIFNVPKGQPVMKAQPKNKGREEK